MTIFADRVRETSTTTGTGTYSLDGAVIGYQGFVAGAGDAAEVFYMVTDGTDWETGIGTVTDAATDTLSRDTINYSSNSDAAVNWGAGTKTVVLTMTAGWLESPIFGTGFRDLISPLSGAGVPSANAPTPTTFGTTTTGTAYEAYSFAVNDYLYCMPFHVDHDVKPSGKAYIHVHWSTDGTSVNTVKWELTIRRALGHDQATFASTEAVVNLEQAASGTAWQHMVVEDATGITLTEPDEIILVTIKRITNGGTENTDAVFGLQVDFHYETDRYATPNKAPDFYA